MHHLEQVYPVLWSEMRAASCVTLRAVALMACRLGVHGVDVADALVTTAIDTIASKKTLSNEQRAELNDLVVELDETYLRLQEVENREGLRRNEYLKYFSYARAVSAVVSAGGEDAFEAAVGAIYEALATTDEPNVFVGEISGFLKKCSE